MPQVMLDYKEVYTNLEKLKSKFEGAVESLCESGAEKMESYAKENRPWTDRTGRARQSLKGSWEGSGTSYKIQIAHGVSYGVYLEMGKQRSYAILGPTLQEVGYGQIMPAFQNLVNKLG